MSPAMLKMANPLNPAPCTPSPPVPHVCPQSANLENARRRAAFSLLASGNTDHRINCQPPELFTKVTIPHNTPLTPRNSLRKMAGIFSPLDILNLGREKTKSSAPKRGFFHATRQQGRECSTSSQFVSHRQLIWLRAFN
jgi:hypothetical protein